MILDPSTLTAATAFVAMLAGGFLVVIGRHYRQGPAAMLWGLSCLFGTIAITLIVEQGHVPLIFYFAALGGVMAWISMREFHGRPFPTTALIVAGLAWISAYLVLSERWAPLVYQLVVAALIGAAAVELWRGRREKLGARLAMTIMVAAYASALGVGAIVATFMSVESALSIPAFVWVVALQTMANVVLTTMLLVLMIKERSVVQHRTAAETDTLTGLLTRGAFVERARRALAASAARGAPFSGVIFDLDHFKRINDTFGHRTGDAVLRRFGDLLSRGLRRDDVAGRIGGEEFAMAMPGAGPEAAMALAERMRAAFAEEARWVDGQGVKATLSAGVAVAQAGWTLEDVLDAADHALYTAKARGRNSVELRPWAEPSDVVVRVA